MKRSVTLVSGLSGYGKTTFALRYLVNAPLAVRFLFDADFSEKNPIITEYSDRLRLPAAQAAADLDLQLCRGWVLFDPHALFPGRLDAGLEFFCEWALAMSQRIPGDKLLVIDEIWRYCNPQSLPEFLGTVIQTGRRFGLTLMLNSQEPNRLTGTIANGMSELVCFRLQGMRALDWAEEYGFQREEVQILPVLSYVARNLDTGGELRGKIRL